MNTKIITFFIIALTVMMIFTACTEIDPLGVANGVPEGYDPDEYDNDWIYFVEGIGVKRIRLDGSGEESVFVVNDLGANEDIIKIQLDPNRQKIYVLTDDSMMAIEERILSYDLDGGSGEVILNTGSYPQDMTIDHVNGYLYFIKFDSIKRINLDNTTEVSEIFSGAMASPFYITPDYKGGVYFQENTDISKVLTIASTSPLNTVTNTSAGLCYNRSNDFLYYYDSPSIYKLDVVSPFPITEVKLTTEALSGNMLLYQPDNKIYYYDNYSTSKYIIYNINMDGSGTKQVILDNGAVPINAFDILAK